MNVAVEVAGTWLVVVPSFVGASSVAAGALTGPFAAGVSLVVVPFAVVGPTAGTVDVAITVVAFAAAFVVGPFVVVGFAAEPFAVGLAETWLEAFAEPFAVAFVVGQVAVGSFVAAGASVVAGP